jgi:hypothetical protein
MSGKTGTLRRAKHQQGAVLVEATMGFTSLVLAAGGLLFVHDYAYKHIQAAEQAREMVWRKALTECDQGEPLFKDLAQDVINGDLPVPDGLIPTPVNAQASLQVESVLDHRARTATESMAFICNPKPSKADPLAKPNEWVMSLFL